jgi:hypothetical protein
MAVIFEHLSAENRRQAAARVGFWSSFFIDLP